MESNIKRMLSKYKNPAAGERRTHADDRMHFEVKVKVEEVEEEEMNSFDYNGGDIPDMYTKSYTQSVLENIQQIDSATADVIEIDDNIETDAEIEKAMAEEALEFSKLQASVNDDDVQDVEEDLPPYCVGGAEAKEGMSPYDIVLKELLAEHKKAMANVNYILSEIYLYKCQVCNVYMDQMVHFKSHLQSQHRDASKIVILRECIKTKYQLVAYKRKSDSSYTKYCHQCSSAFYSKDSWEEHRASDRFNCVNCHMVYTNCNKWRSHQIGCKTKKGQPSFLIKCRICEDQFSSRSILKDHLSIVHVVRSNQPISVCRTTCKMCFKIFPGKLILHDCPKGEHRYYCNYCAKGFQTCSLRRLHLKSFPFVNKECPKCNLFIVRACMVDAHVCNVRQERRKPKSAKTQLSPEPMETPLSDIDVSPSQSGENRKVYSFVHVDQETNNALNKNLQSMVKIEQNWDNLDCDTIVGRDEAAAGVGQVDGADMENVNAGDDVFHADNVKVEVDVDSVNDNLDNNIVAETGVEFNTASVEECNKSLMTSPMFSVKMEVKRELIDEDDREELKNTDQDHMPVEKQESLDNDDMEDDFIILNCNEGSPKEMFFDFNDNSTQSDSDGKLEIVLSHKVKKKMYKCSRCQYTACHRDYREHLLSCAVAKEKRSQPPKLKKRKIWPVYVSCEKCDKAFFNFEAYMDHFQSECCLPVSCWICGESLDTYEALVTHIHGHVGSCLQPIKCETGELISYQCGVCKMLVDDKGAVNHWAVHTNYRFKEYESSNEPANEYPHMKAQRLSADVLKGISKIFVRRRISGMSGGCLICGKVFSRFADLKRHIIGHLLADALYRKENWRALRCQFCKVSCPNTMQYKGHMRIHAKLRLYQCHLCDKLFSDSSNFSKHRKVHNIEVLVCDLCLKKFSNKNMLVTHLQNHEKKKELACKVCAKEFSFESMLKKHMRVIHIKVLKFGCQICSQRFGSTRLKWDHMWHVHKERKVLADCRLCGAQYRKTSDLKRHVVKHHGRQFKNYHERLET